MKYLNLALYFTFIFLLIIPSAFSQTPEAINYQAVFRDANGNLLKNKSISLLINIIDSSQVGSNTPGDTAYTETHDVTTNDLGQVNFHIGNGVKDSLSKSFYLMKYENHQKPI